MHDANRNLGNELRKVNGTSKYLFLVPLFYLKALNRVHRAFVDADLAAPPVSEGATPHTGRP